MKEPDWVAAQRDERRGVRGMAAATGAFGAAVWLMMTLLNNDRTGLFIASACFAAIFVACVWGIAKRTVLTRELRSFVLTLAVWTGLVGLMALTAALMR